MPGSFNIFIGQTSLYLAMGKVLNQLIEPPDMKVRGIEIRRLIPGHSVILRSGGDYQKSSQEDERRNQSFFQRGYPFVEFMSSVQIK